MMQVLQTPGHLNIKCHECDTWLELVVELGEAPDHESSTAHICLPCLEKALDLLRKATA